MSELLRRWSSRELVEIQQLLVLEEEERPKDLDERAALWNQEHGG